MLTRDEERSCPRPDLPRSNLRMLADQSLQQGKYSGRKISRKDFESARERDQDDDEDEEDDEDDDDDDENAGYDIHDDEDEDEDSQEMGDSDSMEDEDEDEDEDDDEEDDEDAGQNSLFNKAFLVESSLKKMREQGEKQSAMKLIKDSKGEREKVCQTRSINQS